MRERPGGDATFAVTRGRRAFHTRLRRGAVAAALALGVGFTASAQAQAPATGALPSGTAVTATALPPTATPGLPTSVDLRNNAVPVGNQGGVGSCVAWTIAHGMMGWYAKSTGQSETAFAPMYMYSQLNGGSDSGIAPNRAMALTNTQGNDTVAHYSHGDFDWQSLPNAAEIANAAKYKMSGYKTLFAGFNQGTTGRVALQNALAGNHPVAISFPVRPGFDNLNATTTLDRDYTGDIRGYHEVLALGYDADGLLVQNSWGTGWGSAGYGRIAWEVVERDVYEANVSTGWGQGKQPIINSVGAVSIDSRRTAILGNADLFTASSATVTIKYGTTSALGSTVTSTLSHDPTTTTSNAFGTQLVNLTPNTTYYYSVSITSSLGTTTSGTRRFKTAQGPVINDVGVISPKQTQATVLGNVSLFGAATGTVTARYGTTTGYGQTFTQSISHTAGATDSTVFGGPLTGLTPGTVYHYSVTVTTSQGSFTTEDKTFTTAAPPVINDVGAIGTAATSKNILGNASLFAAQTGTVTYRYGTSSSYGTTISKPITGDGTSQSSVFGTTFTGLTAGTVYHYSVTVTTSQGTATTGDRVFSTPGPPVINDLGAIPSGPTKVSVLGNAQLFAAATGTVTVRYGTTTGYGLGVTKTVANDPESASTTVIGAILTGLTPNTTYHYSVTVATSAGTVTSPDRTVKTPAS